MRYSDGWIFTPFPLDN